MMATVKMQMGQRLIKKIKDAMPDDEMVQSAMENVAKRMQREIDMAAFSTPNREPGILPTICTGNTHVFASMADRCMCGALENN